jgi:hypothetical protein
MDLDQSSSDPLGFTPNPIQSGLSLWIDPKLPTLSESEEGQESNDPPGSYDSILLYNNARPLDAESQSAIPSEQNNSETEGQEMNNKHPGLYNLLLQCGD